MVRSTRAKFEIESLEASLFDILDGAHLLELPVEKTLDIYVSSVLGALTTLSTLSTLSTQTLVSTLSYLSTQTFNPVYTGLYR